MLEDGVHASAEVGLGHLFGRNVVEPLREAWPKGYSNVDTGPVPWYSSFFRRNTSAFTDCSGDKILDNGVDPCPYNLWLFFWLFLAGGLIIVSALCCVCFSCCWRARPKPTRLAHRQGPELKRTLLARGVPEEAIAACMDLESLIELDARYPPQGAPGQRCCVSSKEGSKRGKQSAIVSRCNLLYLLLIFICLGSLSVLGFISNLQADTELGRTLALLDEFRMFIPIFQANVSRSLVKLGDMTKREHFRLDQYLLGINESMFLTEIVRLRVTDLSKSVGQLRRLVEGCVRNVTTVDRLCIIPGEADINTCTGDVHKEVRFDFRSPAQM